MPPEKDRRCGHATDETAVKVAGARHQRHRPEVRCRCSGVGDRAYDQQQLRADQRAHDRPGSERHDQVGVQLRAPGAAHQPAESRQIGRGKQYAERMQREERRGEKSWVHVARCYVDYAPAAKDTLRLSHAAALTGETAAMFHRADQNPNRMPTCACLGCPPPYSVVNNRKFVLRRSPVGLTKFERLVTLMTSAVKSTVRPLARPPGRSRQPTRVSSCANPGPYAPLRPPSFC